jgi:hypothetical protein
MEEAPTSISMLGSSFLGLALALPLGVPRGDLPHHLQQRFPALLVALLGQSPSVEADVPPFPGPLRRHDAPQFVIRHVRVLQQRLPNGEERFRLHRLDVVEAHRVRRATIHPGQERLVRFVENIRHQLLHALSTHYRSNGNRERFQNRKRNV